MLKIPTRRAAYRQAASLRATRLAMAFKGLVRSVLARGATSVVLWVFVWLACSSPDEQPLPQCQPAEGPLSVWNSECGNGVCEIDEATSNCEEDCGLRTVDREPFVLHGGPVPERLVDLHAATRLFVRGGAASASLDVLASIDDKILSMPHSIVVTAVSGEESASSGFTYCLPTGEDLDRWLEFVARGVERYDGDEDPGCTFVEPDCYSPGDGLYPTTEAMAWLAESPIKAWQIENEWLWQAKDCSSGGPESPTPEVLASHLQKVAAAVRGSDEDARIILGSIDSLRAVSALEYPEHHQIVELGLEDCQYQRIAMNEVDGDMVAAVQKTRDEILEVLQKSAGSFDVLDVHHYGSNPYAMLYEAATSRSLLRQAGVAGAPLWSLENGGPFFFFPLLGEAAPATCPPVPATIEEARATGIVGAYDDALLEDFVAKHYAVGLFAGYERIAWSSLVPTIGWSENFLRTSLLDYDYAEKPAYWTYKLLSEALGSVEQIDKPLPEVYRFVLSDGTSKLLVWADHCVGTTDVSALLAAEQVSVTSLGGTSLVNAHEVPVSSSPVLVELR